MCEIHTLFFYKIINKMAKANRKKFWNKAKKLATNVLKHTPAYIVAESAGKAVRKARAQASNVRTNRRRNAQLQMQRLVDNSPEDARIEVAKAVHDNLPNLKKAIEESGQELASNPSDIAVQFTNARAMQVKDIMEDTDNIANDPESANETLDDLEENEDGNNFDDEEYETFDPVTIGVLTGFAKGAISKIKEKRFAKGKKFLGQNKSQAEKNAGMLDVGVSDKGIEIKSNVLSAETDPNTILGAGKLGASRGASEGVGEQMKKYLPYAVGAVALWYFFLRKK